jgi:hypothetical protein
MALPSRSRQRDTFDGSLWLVMSRSIAKLFCESCRVSIPEVQNSTGEQSCWIHEPGLYIPGTVRHICMALRAF